MTTESEVVLSLKALVLFEWLAREDGKDALPTELERVLVEPLRPDYAELLAAARQRLLPKDEG